MLLVLAKIPVRPEKRDYFIEKAQAAIEGSRKEAGNLRYELFKSTENDSEVLYVEQWQDQAAFEAHREMPHFTAFRKVQADEGLVVGERDVRVYEVAE